MLTPRLIPAARIHRGEAPAPAPRRFLSRLTLGAAAFSLALAGAMPAPAKAGGDDLAKGLIAALVVGAVVHGLTKDGKAAPAPAPEPVHGWRDRDHRGGDDRRARDRDHRPGHGWSDPAAIPGVCAIEIDAPRRGGHGRARVETVYVESCLQRSGVNMRALPRGCATEFRAGGKRDRVYPAACLHDAGYRLPGRR